MSIFSYCCYCYYLPLVLLFAPSAAICSAKVEIPKVSPAQCWDSLVLLGGLGSDPFKIIQAIYGSFLGDLTLILDLGTQPILQGESANSVIIRLEDLVRRLVQCLRKYAQGTTRVLVLLPLQPLALNQIPAGPHSRLHLLAVLAIP